MMSLPSKIFVDWKIGFADDHLQEVAQRDTHGGTSYFRLSQETEQYMLNCHLNTESPLIRKDCEIVQDYGIYATVQLLRAVSHVRQGNITPHIIGIPIFTPPSFDRITLQREDFNVPAIFDNFGDLKHISATFHFVSVGRLRSWIVEGFSLAIDARDMAELFENVKMFIAQYNSAI